MHTDCNIDIDLIFLLDVSGSIGPSNFEMSIDFIEDFVNGLSSIGPMDTQVSVITFSSSPRVQFNLLEVFHTLVVQQIQRVPWMH